MKKVLGYGLLGLLGLQVAGFVDDVWRKRSPDSWMKKYRRKLRRAEARKRFYRNCRIALGLRVAEEQLTTDELAARRDRQEHSWKQAM